MSFESDDLISSDEDDCNSENGIGAHKMKNYSWKKSSSSFLISEVLGIMVGGASSRFWMLRKHINTIENDKIGKSTQNPFYSWECMTIKLKSRDVDIIIPK